MPETKRVSLSAIDSTDKRFQVRDTRTETFGQKISQRQNSQDHIKRLVERLSHEGGARFRNIEVTQHPDKPDRYIIVDGFHRFEAYSRVRKASKGKRYKQIRVDILTPQEARSRLYSINTEHKGMPLTYDQRKELWWQEFLSLEEQGSQSIASLAKALGVSKRTISNWRLLKRQLEEAGWLKSGGDVERNEVTGNPMLKSATRKLREEAAVQSWYADEDEPEDRYGALTENDKQRLYDMLSLAMKADEGIKLKESLDAYWGTHPDDVAYDEPLDPFASPSYL